MREVFLLLVLGCWGCGAESMPEPPPHIVPQPGEDKCISACAHMETAGPDGGACEESQPIQLKDGGTVTCSEFCRYQHQNGVFWNTECLLTVKTCEEIETVCNTPSDSGL